MENTAQKHYSRIRQVLILIMFLNLAVALAKIIYGLLTRCTSMAADGFHSLSDGTSNIIGLIGIHFACQPKDKDHPYGHKKYETFFSLGIAMLLFVIAFNLAREGILRIYNPVIPTINAKSFIIMLVTLGINFWVVHYEKRAGQILKSDILLADALHTKADIFTSLSVIITLVVVKLGLPILDPIATILISLFIAYAGINILKHSSAILCDTIAIVDEKMITDVVLGLKGVKACHKIRTRGRPDDIHLDMHVQVSPEMHMGEAHQISYIIEKAIKKAIPEITDIVLHMEPKEKD